jgi:hypothetical protein
MSYVAERDGQGVLLAHSSACKGMCCVPETPYHLSPLYADIARLFGAAVAEDYYHFTDRLQEEGSWWQLFADDLMPVEQRLAAEYAATRPEREAAAAAAVEAFDRKTKVERTAIRVGASCNKHGAAAIRKVAQPCKFLYNCKGTPARPTTMHVTTECWSHASGVCDRMHPGETGWAPQWQTDRTFKPVERFAFAAAPRPSGERPQAGGAAGGYKSAAGGGGHKSAGGGR